MGLSRKPSVMLTAPDAAFAQVLGCLQALRLARRRFLFLLVEAQETTCDDQRASSCTCYWCGHGDVLPSGIVLRAAAWFVTEAVRSAAGGRFEAGQTTANCMLGVALAPLCRLFIVASVCRRVNAQRTLGLGRQVSR